MGRESTCIVTVEGECAEARVQLESSEIVIRGGVRRRIALNEITSLHEQDGVLTLVHGNQTLSLALGPEAAGWAARIRSPRSRLEKLGIAVGRRVALLGLDDAAFRAEVAAGGAVLSTRVGTADLVVLGAARPADLEPVATLARSMKEGCTLWVVWPKGRPQLKEDHIRSSGLAAGLVDVKVVSFSDTHSALKLVRRRPPRRAR